MCGKRYTAAAVGQEWQIERQHATATTAAAASTEFLWDTKT